jgi:ferritin
MYIRNEWNLWGTQDYKSFDLYNWFVERGISHADDMYSIIMKATWCKYHNVEYDLQQDIAMYKEFWSKQNER